MNFVIFAVFLALNCILVAVGSIPVEELASNKTHTIKIVGAKNGEKESIPLRHDDSLIKLKQGFYDSVNNVTDDDGFRNNEEDNISTRQVERGKNYYPTASKVYQKFITPRSTLQKENSDVETISSHSDPTTNYDGILLQDSSESNSKEYANMRRKRSHGDFNEEKKYSYENYGEDSQRLSEKAKKAEDLEIQESIDQPFNKFEEDFASNEEEQVDTNLNIDEDDVDVDEKTLPNGKPRNSTGNFITTLLTTLFGVESKGKNSSATIQPSRRKDYNKTF